MWRQANRGQSSRDQQRPKRRRRSCPKVGHPWKVESLESYPRETIMQSTERIPDHRPIGCPAEGGDVEAAGGVGGVPGVEADAVFAVRTHDDGIVAWAPEVRRRNLWRRRDTSGRPWDLERDGRRWRMALRE